MSQSLPEIAEQLYMVLRVNGFDPMPWQHVTVKEAILSALSSVARERDIAIAGWQSEMELRHDESREAIEERDALRKPTPCPRCAYDMVATRDFVHVRCMRCDHEWQRAHGEIQPPRQ